MNNPKSFRIKRLFSKLLDYGIFYSLFSISLWSLGIEPNILINLTTLFLLPILFAPFEALCISLWKTTMGKAIFSLQVTDENSEKIGLVKSLKRSLLSAIQTICILPIFLHLSKNLHLHQDTLTHTQVEKKRRHWSIKAICIVVAALGLGSQWIENTSRSPQIFIVSNELHAKQAFAKWKQFQVPNTSSTITFPDSPKPIEKRLDIPRTSHKLDYTEYEFIHPETGVRFSIGKTQLPKSLLKWSSSLVLKGSLSIIAKNEKGAKITDKQGTKYRSHPGLDYRMSIGSNIASGRLVLVKDTLYKIDMTYPESEKQNIIDSLQNFLESFNP